MNTFPPERKILYIEDDFHNRRIANKILSSQGYTVLEAENGLSGYQRIKTDKPDLVLLDINLPGMDGIKIAQNAKADPEIMHIPLIAFTANSYYENYRKYLQAGCEACLGKPSTAKELIDIVEKYYPNKLPKPK